jgi:hypothetical protein
MRARRPGPAVERSSNMHLVVAVGGRPRPEPQLKQRSLRSAARFRDFPRRYAAETGQAMTATAGLRLK